MVLKSLLTSRTVCSKGGPAPSTVSNNGVEEGTQIIMHILPISTTNNKSVHNCLYYVIIEEHRAAGPPPPVNHRYKLLEADHVYRLPLPWFLYTVVFQKPISVSSEGLGCSIVLLFSMLVAVFLCIVLSGWKMSKLLGMSMFVLYFCFVGVSLSFEYAIISCPM